MLIYTVSSIATKQQLWTSPLRLLNLDTIKSMYVAYIERYILISK